MTGKVMPKRPGAGAQQQEQAQPETPYSLFITYQAGNANPQCRVMDCPFEDIDTVANLLGTIAALQRLHKGLRITPLFWKVLRK